MCPWTRKRVPFIIQVHKKGRHGSAVGVFYMLPRIWFYNSYHTIEMLLLKKNNQQSIVAIGPSCPQDNDIVWGVCFCAERKRHCSIMLPVLSLCRNYNFFLPGMGNSEGIWKSVTVGFQKNVFTWLSTIYCIFSLLTVFLSSHSKIQQVEVT